MNWLGPVHPSSVPGELKEQLAAAGPSALASTPADPSVPLPLSGTRDVAEVPAEVWQLARERHTELAALLAMAGRRRADVAQAAYRAGCSISWMYTLLKRYGADTRLTSLLPHARGPHPGQRLLSRDLEQLIRTHLEKFYLTRRQPTVSALMREIRQAAIKQNIACPSRRAVQARIDAYQVADVLRRRRGRKAVRDRFGAVTGAFRAAWPMSIVQIDHTLVDVVIVDSLTRRPLKRPWLTIAVDVCTRCVAGMYLALEPPSATSVALCVAHAVLPKAGWMKSHNICGTWLCEGLPQVLHLDNGREFHSEALRRGCEQYGIDLTYRPVRTPHYGGHVERLIGTMMGEVHLLPGTTYSNIAAKGDLVPDDTATLTLDELERWLATAIVGVYHESLHRGIGTTPAAAWQQHCVQPDSAIAIRPLRCDPKQFLIDFLPLERRLIRRDGVVFQGIHYWADVLHAWIGKPERMIVRYDPRDLSRLYLRGPDGLYHDVPYRDLQRPRISLWEHATAVRRLREEGLRAVNESAIFRSIETMRETIDAASRQTKRIRRQQERARRLQKMLPAAVSLPACPKPIVPRTPSTAGHLFADVEEWS